MTHHYDDDDENDDWRTVSVTPLAPGVIATVQCASDNTDTWQWPAVALLHQTRRGRRDQIVLGVLNESGEIEACYSGSGDDHPSFGLELIRMEYGPYMKSTVRPCDSANGQTPANAYVGTTTAVQQDSRP
jgi:hypothetical protein